MIELKELNSSTCHLKHDKGTIYYIDYDKCFEGLNFEMKPNSISVTDRRLLTALIPYLDNYFKTIDAIYSMPEFTGNNESSKKRIADKLEELVADEIEELLYQMQKETDDE